MPAGTDVTVNVVAALPVSKLARFLRPDADPASTTYDVAGSPDDGAVHVSVTALPLTDCVSAVGAAETAAAEIRPVCELV